MKHLTTLLILLTTSTLSFAQFPKDPETGEVVYSDVIELPGMDKQTINKKAKLWLVSTLKSSDNMVELEDADQIIGTGNLVLDSIVCNMNKMNAFLPDVILNFKFIVFCKDDKVKYRVESFLMTAPYFGQIKKSSLDPLKPICEYNEKREAQWVALTSPYLDRVVRRLVKNFEKSMTSKSSDW